MLPGAAYGAPPSDTWREQLRELEQGYAGRIGMYARHMGTGRTLCYRADERFPLLSTFKVLVSAAVLDRARSCAPGLVDRRIRWTEADLVDYSPVTEAHVADGLTVAQLCHAAITRSDNTAGNLLLRQVGGPVGLTGYLRRLGDGVSRLDRWETDLNVWAPGERRDTTTPAAMGRDLAALTVGRALHPDDRTTLVDWMRATVTGDRRIRAGLPAGWTVGDKTGSSNDSYGAANDVAVAHPPTGAPLVLAIYTRRETQGQPYDEAIIAETARVLAGALGAR
ncbi:class A beta-lactamase [Micromonospora thermarum]|nr:class A beta-lactamase [Micromonospora thermarum]